MRFDELCAREATATPEDDFEAARQDARDVGERRFLDRRGGADSCCTLRPGLVNILERRREFLPKDRRD